MFHNLKTIFIDRDGVINKRLIDDYVKTPQQFIFLDGVLKAISLFKSKNINLYLVSNQQGIGKGLMSTQDLDQIHHYMLTEMRKNGGDLDRIYYCPHLASAHCPCRKPKTGMIDQAMQEFPVIKRSESLMIGDNEPDISLAKNAGIKSILIADKNLYQADFCFPDLLTAAHFILDHMC